ncbi:3-(3-hydroxyphenyl)propionate hydroxylase [Yasminevirus sp. GU-2018]|uniref:3-(3-hydroxyphenyl)propionate hydroxylase n=1 Tax=Yasminevirus sp. GU-2018 TaxID=2420051 RepID=A0A5K0UBK3_9VIRU|nr:3-(3-hydroxyphenyl)propionate hydroxylase [Yasminevirus sp. GU-2018]
MGPIGLLLGSELAKINEDFDIDIIDKSSKIFITREFHHAGFLHKRSVDLIKRLTVYKKISQELTFNFKTRYYMIKNKVFEVDFTGSGCALFPQHKLMSGLIEECEMQKNVKLFFGTEFINLTIKRKEKGEKVKKTVFVKIRTENDTSSERVEEYDYVFGADSSSSTVRRNVGIDFKKENFVVDLLPNISDDKTWMVNDFNINDTNLGELQNLDWFINESRPFMYTSFEKRHFRLEFMCKDKDERLSLKEVVSLARQFVPKAVLNQLTEINLKRSSVYTTRNLVADSFQMGNEVFLVGDACHTVVPFLGMGVTCGFDDVKYICDAFKKKKKLTNYTKDRRSKIIESQFKAKVLELVIHVLVLIDRLPIPSVINSFIKYVITFIVSCLPKFFLNALQNYLLH